jgi:Tol biopolymer transport system component
VAAACAAVFLPLTGARAAFEGANGLIAYGSGGKVVVATAGGTTIAGATLTGADPSWSAEGNRLVFASGGSLHIAAVTASGSGGATIGAVSDVAVSGPAACAGTLTDPSFSADASQIAFVSATGAKTDVCVVPAATGSPQTAQNLTNSGDATDPAWSSTGKIAFVRGSAIWTMNADGGGQSQLDVVAGGQADRHPAWSPDGDSIAFESNRAGGVEQIFTMSSSGGSLTRVTNTTTNETEPAYSNDGSTILFARTGSDAGIYSIGAGGGTPTLIVGGASSAPDEQAQIEAPDLVPAPSGAAMNGSTLVASTSGWLGVTDPDGFLFQFQRCDSTGANCFNVTDATSSPSYQLASSDVGARIRVIVSATNGFGLRVTAPPSNATPVIKNGPGPVNTAPPVITLPFGFDAPQLDLFLRVSTGTWEGQLPMTFKYQWEKCDVTTGFCYTIPDADDSFFTPTDDLVGWGLDVRVTATNAAGSTEARTAITKAVTGDAPVNVVSPSITGDIYVASMLSVDDGIWDGRFPIDFSYQWKRCNPAGDLASCVAIPGATSNTYVLQPADQGLTLRAYVTGTNAVASVSAFSIHTFPILPERHYPPSVTTLPEVTGSLQPGFLLRTSVGFWSGDNPMTFTYQWERCDATGANCAAIPRATKNRYTLTRLDLGYVVRVKVTAKNAYGTADGESDPDDPVSLAPHRPKGRYIIGTPKADYLAGGGGNDVIAGLAGNDTIRGGAGKDRLDGGPGQDILDGGPNADQIDGGPGSDTILAADGVKDTIDCGPGNDRVVGDGVDVLTGCESVSTVAPPSTEPTGGGAGGTSAGAGSPGSSSASGPPGSR